MIFSICFFVNFLGNCLAKASSENLGYPPLQNPNLFGGDILGIDEPEDRNAVVDKLELWPNGIVPYVEDPGLFPVIPLFLRDAFKKYERNTCIRFVRRTTEKDYIRIFPGGGCYSYVGRTGGPQVLSLGYGCYERNIVLHELGHALGFHHEQCRSDRDEYLTIYWENMIGGAERDFYKLKPHENQLLTPFDYDSIMLYDSYVYSKEVGKLKTMTKKNGELLTDLFHKAGLSKSDIQRINILYNCKNNK